MIAQESILIDRPLIDVFGVLVEANVEQVHSACTLRFEALGTQTRVTFVERPDAFDIERIARVLISYAVPMH